MSTYTHAYTLFTEIQRQYPRSQSTFTQCACGRMAGRGGGRCALCLTEELGTITSPRLAARAHAAIQAVARAWVEIEESIK